MSTMLFATFSELLPCVCNAGFRAHVQDSFRDKTPHKGGSWAIRGDPQHSPELGGQSSCPALKCGVCRWEMVVSQGTSVHFHFPMYTTCSAYLGSWTIMHAQALCQQRLNLKGGYVTCYHCCYCESDDDYLILSLIVLLLVLLLLQKNSSTLIVIMCVKHK